MKGTSKSVEDCFSVFFENIDKVYPMSEADKQLCRKYFDVVSFAKNTIIEETGTVHNYQNFIVSGYLRRFSIDQFGNEITIDINTGPCFFSSYGVMMGREISLENLEAITDCVLLRIKREDIDFLFKEGNTIQQYTILLFQNIIETKSQKALDLANLSAKERYLKFVVNHPNLVQNVPLQYIASFLGITPQSLSRIRNEVLM